jgi:hypothetical protein
VVLIGYLETEKYKVRSSKRKMPPISQRCPLYHKEENVIYILLKCKETNSLREQFLNDKWLHTYEDIAHMKTISSNKITKLKKLSSFLYKLKCKWENKVEKTNMQDLEELREEEPQIVTLLLHRKTHEIKT